MNNVGIALCLLVGNGVDVYYDAYLQYLDVDDVVGVMCCVEIEKEVVVSEW